MRPRTWFNVLVCGGLLFAGLNPLSPDGEHAEHKQNSELVVETGAPAPYRLGRDALQQGSTETVAPSTEFRPGTIGQRESAQFRLEATAELAELGGPEAALMLGRTVREDEDPWVRVEALHGLAEIGGPGDTQVLIDALADPDPIVRQAAAEALVDVGDRRSIIALSCGGIT